jgi:hypothetical protein
MTDKKILHLTLLKKWFNEIELGIKTTEYRDIKPYWTTRLLNKEFDEIHFKNGYGKNSPFMRVEFKELRIEKGKYALKLGNILEVKK